MEAHPHPQGEPSERNPETLTLLRHAETPYNALAKQMSAWPSFQAFHGQFKREYYQNPKERTVRDDLDLAVLQKEWPSKRLEDLALSFYKDIRKIMGGISDFDMPITEEGRSQAEETGKHIATHVPKPDIIYLSPYLRPRQTLDGILKHAPADWLSVPQWEHESLREQEHGMKSVFNDWRLNYVFQPMEMLHYLRNGSYSHRYHGGESRPDVRDRGSRFIGRLRRKHVGKNVLAVAHHLTKLAIMGELLHWTRNQFIDWDENRKPVNCGVTIFRREKGASRTGRDVLRLDEKEYSMKLYA